MLSYIDPVLFPDQCQILEVEPGRYVYPIFKNGSSSLVNTTGVRSLNYFEMRKIRTVEVFVREPFERYVSGVQTYLKHLPPEYDRDTVLKIIDELLFINRHFALQFHWLVNLQKFTEAWMHIRPIEDLDTVTDLAWNILERDSVLVERFKQNSKLHYYLTLDKIIYEDFIGETVTLKTILKHIQQKHPALYNEVIQRSIDICSVLD